jgi:hypothetical protein
MNALRTTSSEERAKPARLWVKPLKEQVRILRTYYKDVSCDPAFEMKKGAPAGSHGWCAVLRQPTLGDSYGEALANLFEALNMAYDFTNQRSDALNFGGLLRTKRTEQFYWTLDAREKGDLLVFPVYIGWKPEALAPEDYEAEFGDREFGLDALMVGSILLTHPELILPGGSSIDCLGGESTQRKGGHAYVQNFEPKYGEGLGFGLRRQSEPDENCRVATGLLPYF